MQTNIYTISQPGVRPEYVDAVQNGVREFMAMFPEYKDDYNIQCIGQWHSDKQYADKIQYLRQSIETRKLYLPTDDGLYLVPFESTDWAFAAAKQSAISHGRPNQINASLLLDTMKHDPNNVRNSQISIFIVKDDAFSTSNNNSSSTVSNNKSNDFVYGLSKKDEGVVFSTYRLEWMYGDNPQFLKEVITTLAIHAQGHVFNATFTGRHNVSDRDGCGPHCNCPGCVMRSETQVNASVLTNVRLGRKDKHVTPLCPECIAAVRAHMAKTRGNEQEIEKAINSFNFVCNSSRTYEP